MSTSVPSGDNTKTVTTNANGNKAEEVYDAFGNMLETRDIGNATIDNGIYYNAETG